MKRMLIFLLTFFTWANIHAQNVDIDLLRDINLNRNTDMDHLVEGITDSAFPVSIGAPVVIYSIGLIKKDKTIQKQGIYVAGSVLVSIGMSTALKYSINRERPYLNYPDLDNLNTESTPSFPSGHTSPAFATATSLSIAFPKWYVIAPAYIWAGAIGYSRMHIGVHYPSDILGGAIVGSGSAYLSYLLNHWINNKTKKEIFYHR